jgi:hypothetical protein
LLDVARRDLAEFDNWKGVVADGKREFEDRYRREFLSGEQFRRFDRYRERLVELIELPGAGRFVGSLFWVLRMPYRYTRDYIVGLIERPETLNLSEQTVLTGALSGWLDRLQAETLRRAGSHPVWKQIAHGFDAGLAVQARDRFAQDFRTFELKETDELESAGRALVDGLEKNPTLLYTLRGGKLLVDALAVFAVLYFTWVPSWYHLLLLPIVVSITHQLTELLARGAAETARARVRNQREHLVETALTAPLAKWLSEWPATGGSSFEKLQQVLQRVPDEIRKMTDRVTAKVNEV